MLFVDSLQLQFYSMGLTNSHSLNHKSAALPVLSKNYAILAQTTQSFYSFPRTILLQNISHQRFQEWQKTLKQLQRHGEYLCLPRVCSWRTSCVCSQFGEAEIQYQSGIYSLQQEMEHRLPRQQYFQESQLWFMLYLIITLQFRLANNTQQRPLWTIHPQSLIINPEGHMRILVQLQREGEGVMEYVPPEEIPLLLLRLIKSTDERVVMRINKSISETFQLGLTLLSAATLNDQQGLYSRTPLLSLDVDRLANQIERWREGGRYTQVMGALVANLCSFNPADRLSGPQLWEWVNDHAAQIKSRSAFSFRYLPRKITQLVAARIRDSQQGLLRNSRLKMQKLQRMGNSQVGSRQTQMSPRSSLYEQHLYQPIHHIGNHYHPPTPSTSKYRSSFN